MKIGPKIAFEGDSHVCLSWELLTGHLMELGKDEAVQEQVLEVARQFFSNSNITVNLLPALIAGDCDVCVFLLLNYLNLFVQH